MSADMPSRSNRRLLVIASFAAALGCGSPSLETASVVVTDAPRLQAEAKHRADSTCDVVKCEPGQRDALVRVYSSIPVHRRTPEMIRSQADHALADLFRGESLDPAALAEYREVLAGNGDAPEGAYADVLAQLHVALDGEQRARLADAIAVDGLEFMRARPRQPRRTGDDAAGFCARVECTAEQKAQLDEVLAHDEAAGAERERQVVLTDLAAAFRRVELDRGVIARSITALEELREARRHGRERAVIELHELLTPEQREVVARAIEADGIRPLPLARRRPLLTS